MSNITVQMREAWYDFAESRIVAFYFTCSASCQDAVGGALIAIYRRAPAKRHILLCQQMHLLQSTFPFAGAPLATSYVQVYHMVRCLVASHSGIKWWYTRSDRKQSMVTKSDSKCIHLQGLQSCSMQVIQRDLLQRRLGEKLPRKRKTSINRKESSEKRLLT